MTNHQTVTAATAAADKPTGEADELSRCGCGPSCGCTPAADGQSGCGPSCGCTTASAPNADH